MHTFLLCASKFNDGASSTLDRACRITRMLLPTLGVKVEVLSRAIPEIRGGYFYVVPSPVSSASLVSEYQGSHTLVVAFGEIFESSPCAEKGAAEHVYDAWVDGKTDAVRSLEGCFSAVIIDTRRRSVTVVCDLMGRRSLRYFHDRDSLLVSPHDIPIVATGLCPTDMNLLSAASILAFDWSLGGASLLRAISACHPNEYLTWLDGRVERTHRPLIPLDERIHARDTVSLHRQIDSMIDNMRHNTRLFCGDEPVVRMDLTAGLDSRALLAIVLSVIGKSRVRTCTNGGRDSVDVRTAGRLARRYGIFHDYGMPEGSDGEGFMGHCRLRAFMMNGDTDGKRSVDCLPIYDQHPYLAGGGGEMFRGFYYPASLGRRSLAQLTPGRVVQLLEDKHQRGRTLPWISSALAEQLRSLIADTVNAYGELSIHGSDLLDLFYVYERYGRWGAMHARFTWQRRFSPFESPGLLRLGFKLPSPVANDLALHKTIIARYLPAAYYSPINGHTFLPLAGFSPAHAFASKNVGRILRLSQGLWDSLSPKKEHGTSHDQKRGAIFSGLLRGVLRDTIRAEGSVGTRVLEKNGLEKLIDDHISGKANHLEIFGLLAIMESYRQLVAEASDMARQASRAHGSSLE